MIAHRRVSPWIIAEYARLSAGDGESVTRQGAVGVAFTPQSRATWRTAGSRPVTAGFGPNTVFVSPQRDLIWNSWDGPSESLELWLDIKWASQLWELENMPGQLSWQEKIAHDDQTIARLASAFRKLIFADVGSAAFEPLALRLAWHLLFPGRNRPPMSEGLRPLDFKRLTATERLIDQRMNAPLSIGEMADTVGMTPFHFAKAFKLATGTAPIAYLTNRRMERALLRLRCSKFSVRAAAEEVGYVSMGHFRRQFKAHWGISPGELARFDGSSPTGLEDLGLPSH